jgi:hypothetical protein
LDCRWWKTGLIFQRVLLRKQNSIR